MPIDNKKMIEILVAIICLALGYLIGFNQAKLKDQIERLKIVEPEPAVTTDYPKLINENYQNKSEVGITAPKSPQLLEWEAEQQLRTLNDSYRVKPE